MEFGDYPTEQKTIPWKLIGMITGGVVIATVIIGGVLFATRKQAPLQVPSGSTVFGGQATQSEVDCVADPQQCPAAQTKASARASQDPSVCDTLQEGEKDDCYWGVARVMEDVSVCAMIKETIYASQCVVEQIAAKAIRTADPTVCDTIASSEQQKIQCQAVATAFQSEGMCKNEAGECVAMRVMQMADTLEDRAICTLLPAATIATCNANVRVDDPDHDGIETDIEIIVYGTNPRNPDTDQDGYGDKEEIESGHDPLK